MTILEIYIAYLLALVPAIVILIYVYNKDLFPENKRDVVIAFLLGASIVLPLDFLIPIVEEANDSFFIGIGNVFFMEFFRAALLEETLKFMVLFYFASKLTNFNEPMDAIVFGVAASVGYAAHENLGYVFHPDFAEYGAFNIAFDRAFSAIPLHALCGATMGLFFGLALFYDKQRNRNLFLSLFLPVVIHGSYNFFWSLNVGIAAYILLIFLLIKSSAIMETLQMDQSLRKVEDIEQVTTIKDIEIFTNVFYIGILIIVAAITLEVFFQ